jgi:hypothetical protein
VSGTESPVVRGSSLGRTAARTKDAVRLALSLRSGSLVAGGVTVVYLAAYLVALGQLSTGTGTIGLVVVADPLSRTFERVSLLSFEAIALVDLGFVSLQVAPVNLGIGLLLGVLAGLNASLGWLAWRRPACGVNQSAGALAGVPALLSGAACCGPTFLFVVGVQVTSAALAAVVWLVPASILLLVAGLVLSARAMPTDRTVSGG